MKRVSTPTLTGDAKWPLTGGVPSHLSFTEGKRVERIYIAGYQDGSIRIWDATYPVLSLICILEGEVRIPKLNHLLSFNLINGQNMFFRSATSVTQLISYDWQVQGIKVAGSSASVSKLDFCYLTLSLAVGNASGLVRKCFLTEFLF